MDRYYLYDAALSIAVALIIIGIVKTSIDVPPAVVRAETL